MRQWLTDESVSICEKSFQQGVVIYDGECAFCRKQISRIQLKDKNGVFEFLPRQTPGIEQRFPQLTESNFNTGMRLITLDGRILVGADAIYSIMRVLSPWRWFAWLYRVPGFHFLARSMYAWIAANRQSLGKRCADGKCKL